jgi:large subunit ribosomal protein L4
MSPAKGSAAGSASTESSASSEDTAATKARSPRKKPAADAAVQLPAEIFDVKVNVPLIHQVVVAQQAAARQGTHATKTRGAVRGGGRKPYRQKGTGRARQGSIRAPQFAGGGVVHGPHPRSYDQRTPKKMKVAALRGALSDRARHGRVHVLASLVDGDTPSTKQAVAAVRAAAGAAATHVLVVASSSDQLTWRSLRNAQGVHLLDPGQLNTYDVLVSDHVVFLQAALDSFVARTTGEPAVAPAAATTAPAVTADIEEPAASDTEAAEPAPKAKAGGSGGSSPRASTASRAKAKQEDQEQ